MKGKVVRCRFDTGDEVGNIILLSALKMGECCPSLHNTPDADEQPSKVEVSLRQVGIDGDGTTVSFDSLLYVSRMLEDGTEAIQEIGVIRVETETSLIDGACSVKFPLIPIEFPEAAVDGEEGGIDGEGGEVLPFGIG
jgi:hypothetical protein